MEFPPVFSPQDDRASWDMYSFLPKIKNDINRIYNVSNVLNKVDASFVASSLFHVLTADIIPIVGSLSPSELHQFIDSSSRPIPDHYLLQLSSLVSN